MFYLDTWEVLEDMERWLRDGLLHNDRMKADEAVAAWAEAIREDLEAPSDE